MRAQAALLLALLALLGCSRPLARGARYQVAVLAEAPRREALAPLLDSLFSQTWITPMPERRLAWRWADPVNPDAALDQRALLVLVDGPAAGPVGRFAAELLGPGVADRVRQGEAHLLRRPDAFAAGQVLAVLAARDPAALRRQALARADELRALFLEHEAAADAAALRAGGLQRQLEDSLALACGFRLPLPADWFVVQGGLDPPFIRLRRLAPDRWISVLWTEGADSLRMSPDSLWALRGRLAARYWERESQRVGPRRLSPARLGGHRALLLEGTWSAQGGRAAGPFLFWAVHVPGAGGLPQGRTFYIDAEVLDPGSPQSPWLHQLSALVSGFTGTDAEGRRIGPLQAGDQ